jgi:hypothetical protein
LILKKLWPIFSGEDKIEQQEHNHCLMHTSSINPKDKE